MKCEACEFYAGSSHCWVDAKGVDPCPEKPCERFKFDALIGECVAEEREACAKICDAMIQERDEHGSDKCQGDVAWILARKIRAEGSGR